MTDFAMSELQQALELAAEGILGTERAVTDPLCWVGTGITLFDCTLHREARGLPSGRGLHLYGPKGTGKTLLGYLILKRIQDLGGMAICITTERFAPDLARLVGLQFGPGVSNFLLFHPVTIEKGQDVWEKIAMQCLNLPFPVGILFDSIAGADALSNQDTVIAGGKYQQGLPAQLWSRFFKRIPYQRVAYSNVFPIFTNQVRLKLEFWKKGLSAPKEVATGGYAVGHSMDVEIGCRATDLTYSGGSGNTKWGDAKDKTIVGTWLEMKATKNRFGPTHRPMGVPLYYQWGVDDILANLEFLRDNGGDVFKGAGGRYKMGDSKGKFFKDWHHQALEDAALASEIRACTVERYRALYHDWSEERR